MKNINFKNTTTLETLPLNLPVVSHVLIVEDIKFVKGLERRGELVLDISFRIVDPEGSTTTKKHHFEKQKLSLSKFDTGHEERTKKILIHENYPVPENCDEISLSITSLDIFDYECFIQCVVRPVAQPVAFL